MGRHQSSTLLMALSLLLAGIASRLLPHAPNFAPLESLALISGAFLSLRMLYIIVPMVVFYLGDLVLNNTALRSFYPDQEGIVWFSDYMIYTAISIVVIVALGRYLGRKSHAAKRGASVVGSVLIFFLITNLGSWASSMSLYADGLTGIVQSYVAAIPFLFMSLLSNLIFSAVVFYAFDLWLSRQPVTQDDGLQVAGD